MKRIAIMAAMALLLTLNLGALANAQSGTSSDLSGAVAGQFSQAQGVGAGTADTQSLVQSLQAMINQLQSQSGTAAAHNYGAPAAPAYQAPAYQAPAYQAPAYQAPAYQAPAFQAPVYSAPQVVQGAPQFGPPLPPIQLPPVTLPAIDLPAPPPPAPVAIPAPAPQVQVFTAPQPQTVFVPVLVQQPQRRHGCRLSGRN